MNNLFIFLLFLCIAISASVILGAVAYYRNSMRLRKFRRFFDRLSYPLFLTTCIWSLIIAFISIISLTKISNFKLTRGNLVTIVLFISILALLRLEEEYKLSRKISEWPKTAATISSALALVVAVITKATVDEKISAITLSNAAAFPNAQNLLLILAAPLVWLYLLTFVALIFYLYHFALLLFYFIKNFNYFHNIQKSICFIVKAPAPYRNNDKEDLKYLLDKSGVFAALFVFITFIVEGVPRFLNSDEFDNEISDLIVSASFHVPAKACNNVLYKDSAISFTWDDNIVVAIPIQQSRFFFYVDTCDRPIKKKE